mmetsp:Transcript_95973/g.151123  ORF Transcript_95973/g.151123 Transcript_95973/m.151123 type:complete len:159 (-) Transcript_95973:177-653(-)
MQRYVFCQVLPCPGDFQLDFNKKGGYQESCYRSSSEWRCCGEDTRNTTTTGKPSRQNNNGYTSRQRAAIAEKPPMSPQEMKRAQVEAMHGKRNEVRKANSPGSGYPAMMSHVSTMGRQPSRICSSISAQLTATASANRTTRGVISMLKQSSHRAWAAR